MIEVYARLIIGDLGHQELPLSFVSRAKIYMGEAGHCMGELNKQPVGWFKDLVCTTFHLIKVSRDAGLWSWTQLWDIFYTQTFAPMIRAEKGNVDTAVS
ncbi:unnamed protein product [Angiostrongylus costaricensis]|uniref:Rab-GAP TBC domain-containing protein n=1 Tax=Angiostrongylus costaricensis TaxID=334426 RepID=A0A0R3PY67_ANGCS|nr:unnamed protein product [Angiostrongylus costaricensis]